MRKAVELLPYWFYLAGSICFGMDIIPLEYVSKEGAGV